MKKSPKKSSDPKQGEDLFQSNLELWAAQDPKRALMLQYHNPDDAAFDKILKGEAALKEAQNWFSSLDLHKVELLLVYGVGLGYAYQAAKDWLKKDSNRRIAFLEDNISIISRFLETETASELLSDPKAHLYCFNEVKESDPLFDGLYWNYAMMRLRFTALPSYKAARQSVYDALEHKIAYDFAMKNALVDEYLRFGGPFFINFYQNMLSLPRSYLGNKTFGSFRNVPAIICGAGPSLTKNLPHLAKVLDKALVFAGGSALNALNAAGLQPHLGAGIDPNPAQYLRLSSNEAFEVPFYYRNRMHHDAFESIHGPRLYITGCGGYDVSEYFEERLKIAAPFLDEGHNVINFCLQIATELECNPIIFIGLDLAFTGMQSYAPGVEAETAFAPENYGEADEFDERPILLKDIYGEPLYTLWKWVAESEWISNFAKENPEKNIVNATEGGLGFEGVRNISFAEMIENFLNRSHPMDERLHNEIQGSAMPQVTPRKVVKLMKELRESLVRCIAHFDLLIEENVQALESDQFPYKQSGRAALCETELGEEDGYQYVLAIFNEVKARLYNRHLHEINALPEKKRQRKRLEFNRERFEFLRDVARVNVGTIDLALQKRKKEIKREKAAVEMTSELPSVDSKESLVPKEPFEGQKVGRDHFVMMSRKYGMPPEEVRLEARGQPDGQCLLYYPDGSRKGDLYYKEGLLHGPAIFYSTEGIATAKTYFQKGLREGESHWFYADGALYALLRYKKGKLHGRQEYFYPDGATKTLLEYVNGKLKSSNLY